MTTKQLLPLTVLAVACVVLLWAGRTGPAGAQESEPPEALVAQDENEPMAVVPGAIGVQGRLTDASGNPLNGNYGVTFNLYDSETGTLPLCSDTNTVNVQNGLFNSYIDNCYNALWGQKVWLGVKVGSDPEMAPRQVILPVAYALTIKPGAVISGTVDPILTVRSTGQGGDYDGLFAFAGSTGEAVQATALDGIGVVGYSNTDVALQGYSLVASSKPAIYGCTGSTGACDPERDNNPAGVMGYSTREGGDGVHGTTNSISGRGVYGMNTGAGIALAGYADSTGNLYPTLYLVQHNPSGNFVVGASNYWGERSWRVDRTGKGFFNGGVQASGADFAEQMGVVEAATSYQPGDILVISSAADQVVERSTGAFSSAVIGVYSTNPAMVANAHDSDDPLAGIPVAVVGIVPAKVSAENGPIQRGDLLVTAATPGHAMRAGPNPPQGTVLGKALQPLASGTGVISIVVSLQ